MKSRAMKAFLRIPLFIRFLMYCALLVALMPFLMAGVAVYAAFVYEWVFR